MSGPRLDAGTVAYGICDVCTFVGRLVVWKVRYITNNDQGDDRRPACARCEKAGIECVRGFNVRFRHGSNPSVANTKGSGLAKIDYDFSKKQKWVKIARTLTFLDETQELMSLYDHDEPEELFIESTPVALNQGQSFSSPQPTTITSKATQSPLNGVQSGCPSSAEVSMSNKTVQSPISKTQFSGNEEPSDNDPITADRLSKSSQSSPASIWQARWMLNGVDSVTNNPSIDFSFSTFSTVPSPAITRVYPEPLLWPLREREEAMLLRHYVETLARSFDLTDPQQHFKIVVPLRASTCPTLLNAILALSARHLSRIANFDPFVSNKYHQECLQHLIPMLDDTAAILDENLLASTIILRHLEELEVPVSGHQDGDQQSYLLGAQALITAQERAAVAGGLRQAAFWVGLRQEVHVAWVNQRSIMPALEHCNIDRSFEPAEDHIWSCRMVVLCADVLRHCFGETPHSSATSMSATYDFLTDSIAEWHRLKPSTFSPMYYRAAAAAAPTTTMTTRAEQRRRRSDEAPDGTTATGRDTTNEEDPIFPELWFVNDIHSTGLQHYHLARILLSAHDPRVPRLGPGRQAAIKAMDEEIRSHVLVLCGICRSNDGTAANFGYAAMAITMAGDKFCERRQQEGLLDVLVQCERQHGWPTQAAQRNLRGAWGWGDSTGDEEEEGRQG